MSPLLRRSFIRGSKRTAGKGFFDGTKTIYGHQPANQRGRGVYHRTDNGFGFNSSNNVLVSEGTGLQMGAAPATRDGFFCPFDAGGGPAGAGASGDRRTF